MEPLWRISGVKGDIFETDGKVDEVEVKILQSHVSQTSSAGSLNMIRMMKCVPQLGGHKQFFSFDFTSRDGISDAKTNLEILFHDKMYLIYFLLYR